MDYIQELKGMLPKLKDEWKKFDKKETELEN